jgi:hypothetical protein
MFRFSKCEPARVDLGPPLCFVERLIYQVDKPNVVTTRAKDGYAEWKMLRPLADLGLIRDLGDCIHLVRNRHSCYNGSRLTWYYKLRYAEERGE